MNFLVGVILILGVIGFVTNPDKDAHLAGISQHVEQESGALAGTLMTGVLTFAKDELKWENYYVCSRLVGPDGEVISWGAFTRIIVQEE